MKKDGKLRTVNKWNREVIEENLFWPGGKVKLNQPQMPVVVTRGGTFVDNSGPSLHSNARNFFASNRTPVGNATGTGGNNAASKGAGWAQAGAMAAGIADKVPTGDPRGLYDTLDPIYHLGKGRQSAAGNALSDAGVDTFKAGAQSGNGWMMLAGAGLKIIGGLTNAAWGHKVDQAKLDAINNDIARNNNFVSNATSFDAIQAPAASVSNTDVYSDGWFTNDSDEKNEELRKRLEASVSWANRSVDNNVFNIASDQNNDILYNYSALGGPIETMSMDDNMGAIGYGFMSDYLNNKRQQTEQKNQTGNMFAGMPNSMFAFGGDMQSNYGDYPTGLTHIDAGGSHEENPNDGVQMGVDNEGTPNLVEEGETVWDDYVFSNRITCDETTKKLFHLPKKKDVTYAEVSKKLEREISERPNDPISRAGFNAQMQKLEEQQERQKQEMEAERAKAAFEALSPEEQTAVMQQVAQQETARENLAAQAEPTGETVGTVAEQPIGEAMGTVAQQRAVEQPMMAEGGKLFETGGDKKKNVGTWKDDKENHWDVFTKPGLKAYIESIKQRLAMAPDDATKDAIRKEAMNELNSLQQSYFSHVLPDAGKEKYDYSKDIKNHQLLFDKLYGNTGFYSTDDNGNVRNLIADAINLPNGAATEDKPEHWADGYNGRRTSIRNFGSTEYGDDKYYKDLVDEFAQLGLTYAPNENWKYGDNQLYALSIPEATTAKATEPKVWDWNTGDWVDRVAEPEEKAPGTVTKVDASTVEEENEKQAPKQRPDWMRYAGLFGPAAGLGLMAAGVGKPDYSRLDAALEGAGNVHLADYKPLGNYLTYRPMDIWFEQNRMDANARATDRAILNNASPIGTKMAGLLASGYNNQIADGELYRKALEYNDEKRRQVAEFNRGTDQFNADAYNRTSQFNANALNHSGQFRNQLALQAATERLNRDAGWYNSLYGNVSGLFRGFGDLGRENAQWNMISKAAADTTNLGDSNTSDIYLKKKKKSQGGKVRRKRGLTY